MTSDSEKPKIVKQVFLRTLRTLALAYVAVCALLYFFQEKILYHPTEQTALQAKANFDRLQLSPWPDLENYRALYGAGPAMDPGPTILYLHGNGGTADGQASMIARFRPLRGRVFLYEFPGYGPRPGEINEESFVKDLAETIDMLAAERPGPMVLVGSSLGTAVICGSLRYARKKVDAVVLFTPFTTLADAAAKLYWYLPTRLLVRETYDNVRALQDYDGRLAVIVAEDDGTTPPELGEAVHDSYAGPKKFWTVVGAGHGDWYDKMTEAQWQDLNNWLNDGLAAIEKGLK